MIGETGMVDNFDVSLSSSFIGKKRQQERECGSARCKTCAMVQDIQEIQFADQPGRREVIRGKFTCASTNVVYLLTCTACQAAYVGETGCTLRERMNGHRPARTPLWPTILRKNILSASVCSPPHQRRSSNVA